MGYLIGWLKAGIEWVAASYFDMRLGLNLACLRFSKGQVGALRTQFGT